MYKAFRFIVVLLSMLSVVCFLFSDRVAHRKDANVLPTISMESDEVTILVGDGPEAILAGITATDPEDGDVTDSLVVESLGNMIDHTYRNAVICAFDGDGHVVKTKRKVCYEAYHSPEFTLSGPLTVASNAPSTVMDRICVIDVIDGNISDQVQIITESAITTAGVGDYPVHLLVSNSAGDTVDLPVTLTTYSAADKAQAPTIELTNYLIYVEQGSKPIDAMTYLDSVKIGLDVWEWKPQRRVFNLRQEDEEPVRELEEDERPLRVADLHVVNTVNTSKPGVYEILYQLRDYADNEAGRVRLIVVVRE